MKIFNTHTHFGVEIGSGDMDLKKIFNFSYVGWQNQLLSEDELAIRNYFNQNMTMTCFVELKKSLEILYGDGLLLNSKTWEIFDNRVKKAHKNPDYKRYVLKRLCNYQEIVLDDYINIRNNKFDDLECKVALRCDFIFYGYSKESLESSESNYFDFYDSIPDNIDDYVKKINDYIEESLEINRCQALKVCMAYFRDINFEIVDKEKAKLVYKDPNNPIYIKYFQDYIMSVLCEIAENYNIPIQIHTGLGQIDRTSAINLLPIIKKYSNVKFAMLHGSFPWIEDLLAILYHCQNAYLDISWMPLLSQEIAKRTLITSLELVGSERIMWGCDTATVEESYAALLSSKIILEDVSEYFMEKNILNEKDSQLLKEKIFYKNAKSFFGYKSE